MTHDNNEGQEEKMRKLFNSTLMALMLASSLPAVAAKDVGEGHDHRTFHADGNIDYGKIGDSYTADLVMYLAGNQFMVKNLSRIFYRSTHRSSQSSAKPSRQDRSSRDKSSNKVRSPAKRLLRIRISLPA
jgi:intein-encoded DNA endonuclease-like protein